MPRRVSGSDSEPDLVDELQSDAPDHESDSADSDGSERYWDGLKDLEGTHRTVYLHSIPESRKKYLEQKIAKLQGTIAQSAKDSDVLILPEVKDKILWKKRHKRVKPVAWLEKRYSKLFDDDEERSAPRTKNSSKPWDPDHGPKFVRYMVEARLRGLNLRTGSTYAPLIKNESHNKNYRWAEGYTTDALKRRYVRRAEEFDHKIALEFLDRSPTDAPPTPEPSPGPIVRKRTQDVEDEEEQEFGDTSHRDWDPIWRSSPIRDNRGASGSGANTYRKNPRQSSTAEINLTPGRVPVEPTSRNSHNMPTPSPQRQPLFRSTPDPSEGVQLADANTDWVLPRLSPLSNDVMDMAPPPLKWRGTRATLSASQRPKNTSRNTDPPESQQTIVPGLSPSPRRQQLEDIIFPSTASTAVTLVEPLGDPLTGELTFEEKRALLKSHKFIPSTPEPVRVPPSSSPFVTAFRANRAPRRSLLSQATPRSTGTLVAESSTPRLTLNAASPPTVFRAGSQLRPPGSARSSLAPALSQAVAEAMPVEDQIELEALCEEFGFTFEEALKEYVLQEGNVRKTLFSLDNKLAYAEILSEPLRDPTPSYEGHEYDAAERQAEQELQQEAMSVEADSEAEELVDSLVTPRKRKMRAASVSSGSSISSAVTREGSHSSLDVEDMLGAKAETQPQEIVPGKAAAVPADEGEEDSEDETAPRPTRTTASRRQRRLDLPYPKFAPRGSQAHEAAAKLWKDAQRDLEQPRYQTRSRSRKK